MRNNSIFTYVLYGLIGLLVILAGYKACQIKNNQANKLKQDQAYLDETLKNVPYIDPDSTVRQTAFEADTTPAGKSGSAASDGIEYDKPAAKSSKTTTPAPKTIASPKPVTPPVSTEKTTVAKPKPAAPVTAKPAAATGSTGKYLVVTGAFKSIENARDEMETLVKSGYQNAEVKSLASGYYHSIATRSNDKAAAQKIADLLKTKGYPRAYVRAAQ